MWLFGVTGNICVMIAALSYSWREKLAVLPLNLVTLFSNFHPKKGGYWNHGELAQKTRAENRFVWFKQWTHRHSLQFHRVMSWVLKVCENRVL